MGDWNMSGYMYMGYFLGSEWESNVGYCGILWDTVGEGFVDKRLFVCGYVNGNTFG